MTIKINFTWCTSRQLTWWMYVLMGPFPSLPVMELSSSPNLSNHMNAGRHKMLSGINHLPPENLCFVLC